MVRDATDSARGDTSSIGNAPLTEAQKQLWILAQTDDDASRAYNVPLILRLRGQLDIAAMRYAIQASVDRHEALRTTISEDGEEQRVHDFLNVDVPIVDLSEPEDRDNKLTETLTSQSSTFFDLHRGPLFRACIIKLDDQDHLLSLVAHHIVVDGWSMIVLVKDIAAAYAAKRDGEVADQEPPLQFREYANWLSERLADPRMQENESYWLDHLANPPELELPSYQSRPPLMTYRGARHTVTMNAELVEKLNALSQQSNGTLFMTLLAGYMALLHRLSGQDDLIVGVPVTKRSLKGGGDLVGYCVNMVPIRDRITEDVSFKEYFAGLRDTLLQAYMRADYPFSSLLKKLNLKRDPSRSPLVTAVFNMNPALTGQIDMPGLDMELFEPVNEHSRHELSLNVISIKGELLLEFEYHTDLFDAATIERFAERLVALFESATADPDQRFYLLPVLTEQERQHLLVDWNATETKYSKGQCLHQWIEAQVEKTPEATAVRFEDQSLSYAELNARANQLAHHLRTLGVGPDVLVGICLERSIEMVVGLLGVIKAGGAYAPLDPEYPQERLAYMLADAKAPVLLTQQRLVDGLPEHQAQVFCLDSDWGIVTEESATNPVNQTTVDDLAYVIYTSGSTGKPKGVAVPHRGIVNRLQWMQAEYRLDETDRVLQKTPFSFDVSVWEFFWPLMTGARLVVAKPGGHKDSAYLAELIAEQGITTLHFVPPMLAMFLEEPGIEAYTALRRIICSGEALPFELMQRYYSRLVAPLHNLYGPTEASVDVTYWACDPDTTLPNVPIGRPIANTQMYILDANLNPVPVGVAGELHIGGVGLARGYINRPKLTAEKFIANPFSDKPGERLYKTGDLARYLPDGNIEFLGRIDHQVKIRGFRIELGEIEAALLQHESVHEAVVIAREDHPGDKRLAAYVVAAPDAELDASELRAYLKDRLPNHMVPAAFVVLDALPLSPNGKVDRQALPAPQIPVGMIQEYVAPRTPAEESLAKIWGEVLHVKRVSVLDNFFALGGDSISAIQVVSRARDAGFTLSVQDVFKSQNLKALAGVVDESRQLVPFAKTESFDLIATDDRAQLPESIDDAYPLAALQSGMLFHSALNPESAVYHDVFSYHLRAPFDSTAFSMAVREQVRRHPVLRTSFELSEFSQPIQLVHHTVEIPITIDDLTPLSEGRQRFRIDAWIEQEKKNPFEWQRPPLLRYGVHLRANNTFQLTISFHHAILDGWSVATMLTELFTIYFNLLHGETERESVRPKVSYRDFISLEKRTIQAEEIQHFWNEALQDVSIQELPRWPTDLQPELKEKLGVYEVPISTDDLKSLRELSQEMGLPMRTALLAAHLKVLSTLFGVADTVTGLVTNGRVEEPGGQDILGLFLNTIPFRLTVEVDTWAELIKKTHNKELELLGYRRYPLAEIQNSVGGTQLFEVAFNFVHFHVFRQLNRFQEFEYLGGTYFERTNFALLAQFVQDVQKNSIDLQLRYDAGEFSEEHIKQIGEYYARAVHLIARSPHSRHDSCSLLSGAELETMLVEWNSTETNYLSKHCLHQRIEAQVERTPEATAVAFENRSLSYAELNGRANQLAHHLRKLGVGPDSLVGISVERSIEMVVGLLGILKAGGAYAPLDPEYPKERLAYMLADAQAPVLLTQQRLVDGLPEHQARVFCLDSDWGIVTEESATNPINQTMVDDLAYVIYTSGSTGKPKGVAVPHRGIVNRLQWMQAEYRLDETDRVLQKTPFSFDVSVWEFFWPLMTGARLVVAKPGGHKDSAYLAELIAEQGITTLHFVPPMLAMFLEEPGIEAYTSLRRIICSGEALPFELMQRYYSRLVAPLHNLYGPTEASVDVTYWACDPDTTLPNVPIGRPIANTQMYILDANLNPVPVGVAGELHIGGVGLARGYINRPKLTAEKFIANPFSDKPGERLYKTGDLARYLPDGNIEFLGRIDHQVKIRGFRIELGEIEATLLQHDAVREAVVIAREDHPGDKRLAAYVVAAPDAELDASELRAYLKDRLPNHMVPAAFVMLDALPLSPNGKVDRKALPAPEVQPDLAQEYVAPRTQTEIKLAQIWTEVLDIKRVGVHDDFFNLGGHSLLATQVATRVRAACNVEIPLQDLFESTTIARLAAVIDKGSHAAHLKAKEPEIAPVSRQARRIRVGAQGARVVSGCAKQRALDRK